MLLAMAEMERNFLSKSEEDSADAGGRCGLDSRLPLTSHGWSPSDVSRINLSSMLVQAQVLSNFADHLTIT